MRPPVILLATVQHTGTWFLLDMLTSSRDVAGWTFKRKIREGDHLPYADTRSTVLQMHFGDETYTDLEEHLNELEFWIHALPTIVCLRDPVLSLISRQVRHPEIPSIAYLVDGFERIAKLRPLNVYFVNVDRPVVGRQQLAAIFDALEISPPSMAAVDAWLPHNTSRPHPLKRAYAAGDLDTVAAALPKSWPRLMQKRAIIRDFLQGHGYPSLPWY